MKQYICALVCLVALGGAACNSSTSTPAATGVAINVLGAFTTVGAGTPPKSLTATVAGDTGNHGVKWELSVANTACSPACGSLKVTSDFWPNLTAVYTPPAAPPLNQVATITVRSMADDRQVFVFNFQILPPISVTITNKFSTQTAGGPVVDIAATISNDATNGGLTWTLTAGGANCSPACGTLSADPSPALAAHYQPPATPPSGANASPTITATSVADSAQSDSFSFTIGAPPIVVSIINKVGSVALGGPGITVNASITNDFTGAGLSWTLTAGGAPCAPACGTLTAAATPSLSAAYAPPATLPTGANANPTITVTSVADATKSDFFSFTLVTALSLFKGSYGFLLRGYDHSATTPMALAGSIASDGNGKITGGELDLNDGGVVSTLSALTGSYTLNTSFNGVPRVSIMITSGSTSITLKCALSSDGARGKAIEFDGSHALAAGTILLQDPAALTAANPAGNYAFGVDSDTGLNAGVSGRIVEAGQFILGPGGNSVTSGIADAGQAGALTAIFGGPSGGAPLDSAASSATAPDAFGRGTLKLSFAGTVMQYAYYIVNGQQLNLIQSDSGGTLKTVQSGVAQRQKALTADSVNATSVVALTGTTVSGGVTAPDVIIGVFSVSGGSAFSATFDTNRAGTVLTRSPTSGSIPVGLFPSAAFDLATGRYLVVNNPLATNFVGASVIYLYDTGKGFLIDVTPSNGAFNHAFSGQLVPRVAGPFSISNHLSGNAIGLGGGSSSSAIPNLDFALNFAGGSASSANYSAVVDLTTSNTAIGANGQVPDFSLSNSYLIDDTNLGHGQIGFTGGVFGNFSASQTDIVTFYLIGPNQIVAIEASGLGPSGVLFFDPQ